VRVRELWRYPVKSLRGERLEVAEIGPEGVAGDRCFAVFDPATGYGLTARREPRLLEAAAAWLDGTLVVTLPDGTAVTEGFDEALSGWLGRAVELRSASAPGTRRYENPVDFEAERDWVSWNGARGPFHDSPRNRVSLVTTASLGSWDARRFRANVVLDSPDGRTEADLVGTQVRLGSAVLEVVKPTPRCVMVTRAQPGGIERDLDVLRTINRERGGHLGVGAVVTAPGTVRPGDPLVPVPADPPAR
jgi:hypothetical protein